MATKTEKIAHIPRQVKWLTKARARTVLGTEDERRAAKAVGENPIKLIGLGDIIIEFPQRNKKVKKVLKDQVVSFHHGILQGGDEVMIDHVFKRTKRRAKVSDKIHDSQITWEVINFRA